MKLFKYLTIGLVALAACKQSDNSAYTITGEIEGLPDSTVLVIRPLSHQDLPAMAEAVVKDGKFKFEGNVEEPQGIILSVKDNYGSLVMMLDPANITVTGSVTEEEARDGKKIYSLNKLKIEGSPLYEEYLQVMAPRFHVDSIMIANSQVGQPMMEQYYAAKKEANIAKVDSIEALEAFNKYMQTEKWCFQAFDSVLNATVEQNKDRIWGPIVMLTQLSFVSADQRPLYDMLSDSIKQTAAGKNLYDELYPAGAPGEKVKDFSIGGKSFSELYAGKKAVILDFWASWCRPCRAEIPNLKEIYKKWHDDGLEIISVSIDDDEQAWQTALAKEQLPWINFRDKDDAVATLYKVTAVPTMYVVDGNGILLIENQRGEELANAINEIMTK